jgi:hypothetical protein
MARSGSKIGVLVLATALAGASLGGCAKEVTPPGEAGVCYHLVQPKGSPLRFVPVAKNIATLEDCAAQLERIRMNFLHMGGSIHEIAGAYADQFIFIDTGGIEVSTSLDGPRYEKMDRTPSGKLVRPGYQHAADGT